MSRPVTSKMARALADGNARALFASIDHPDGTGYFWSGIGTKVWNGHTWTGTGILGTVTPIKHTSDIAIQDITFSISGIDPAQLGELNNTIYNRVGSAWLACLDNAGNVVADPYQIIDAVLDYQTLSIADDGTATITITAHTGFYTLDRSVNEAWTPENQHFNFPGDSGLDMIPGLQNQNLQWTPT